MAVIRPAVACLLLVACFLVVSSPVAEGTGRKIIVGGAQKWRFGFNYSDWAAKTGPFFMGDVLVFMYKPSVIDGMPVNHNVLRLHSQSQYNACTFGKAILLANTTEGSPGFEYELMERTPHYFACGIGDGVHCSIGLMKFKVKPM